jgi:hypothetical protein
MEQVEFSFELKGIQQVAIHFKVKGNPSKARPYGYNGVIVKWLVSGKNAENISELTGYDLATRSPYTIALNDEDRRKILSVACQWENRKSQKGPWSDIQSTIVP